MRRTNMRKIWKQKISAINKTIGNTPIGDTEALTELSRKRDLLEAAFNNCG